LEEIVISFKLKLVNHDGKDESITYCPLIIPKVAISMLIESKGSLPNTFKEALDHIRYREEII
jgi:hypothetical protein